MRFDDALTAMVARVKERFPEEAPAETTIVRDAMGMLTLVLPDEALPSAEWTPMAVALDAKLKPFSPGNRRVLLRESDLVDRSDVIESRDRTILPDTKGIALVDRLLTNQDWLREPRIAKPPIPTATFFSIKGGVGRSTAAAVLAWHLARNGKRVFVVDLDLKAPGIGAMLLSDLPDYGMVDWCVESLAGSADAELFEQMLAPSNLAEGTTGDIRVIPAYGRLTPFSPLLMREALERLPDIAAQEDLNPPPLARIYVPLGHQRALSLDSTLVIGMRGAGKSLWTAVLQSDKHRKFVADLVGMRALDSTVVEVGFGLDESNKSFPSAATLVTLVASGVDPAVIWKTVVLINARAAAGVPALHGPVGQRPSPRQSRAPRRSTASWPSSMPSLSRKDSSCSCCSTRSIVSAAAGPRFGYC